MEPFFSALEKTTKQTGLLPLGYTNRLKKETQSSRAAVAMRASPDNDNDVYMSILCCSFIFIYNS